MLHPVPCKVRPLIYPCRRIVVDEVPFQQRSQIEVTETVLKDPVLKVYRLYLPSLRLEYLKLIIPGEREIPVPHSLFQPMEVILQTQRVKDDLILVPLVPSCLQIGKIEVMIGKQGIVVQCHFQ